MPLPNNKNLIKGNWVYKLKETKINPILIQNNKKSNSINNKKPTTNNIYTINNKIYKFKSRWVI